MVGETVPRIDTLAMQGLADKGHKLNGRHKPRIAPTAKLHPGSFIWGDVTVGPYAVIMPNSVLYIDAPPRAVMLGNPAQLADLACDCGGLLSIEQVSNLVTEWPSGRKLLVPLNAELTVACPDCQRTYNAGAICAEVVIAE